MSSTTDPGNRSSAELEREVEGTRARLTDTIEELRERVSPGQLFEQAIDYARGAGGTEMLRNLGRSVRDNPMPLLLIGAGIGWLMLSDNRSGNNRYSDYDDSRRALPPPMPYTGSSGYQDASDMISTSEGTGMHGSGGPSMTERASQTAAGLRDRVGDTASRAGETASDAWRGVAGTASAAASTVSNTASRVTDGASHLAGRAADAAGGAWRSASDTAASLGSRTAETTQRLRERASHLGHQGRSGLETMMRDQPLLLGILGLAVGAAFGAALPRSETEDRLLGETRDSVANRLSSLAEQTYAQARTAANEHMAHAKEAMGETYERAKERLDAGGLSPSAGAETLGQVARDVRQVVEQTVRDVAGQARDATSGNNTPDSGRPA